MSGRKSLLTGCADVVNGRRKGTAVSTPDLRAIVEDLAAEYKLGLAQYFGEKSASIRHIDPRNKLSSLLRIVEEASPGELTLVVIHLGLENPEMSALVDLPWEQDPFRVARHRQAELNAITSPAFRKAVSRRGIRLVTYQQIVREMGLEAMTRPQGPPGYPASNEGH